MIIEINKDIEKYKESVALGLNAKQLICSAIGVAVGATAILLLSSLIGLKAASYIVAPIVAPIALEGFYSFNDMGFYESLKLRLHFLFSNKAYFYSSTECEDVLKRIATDKENSKKKGGVLNAFIRKRV